MKSSLHIIESNSLYGLSDSYEYEIAECIYVTIYFSILPAKK